MARQASRPDLLRMDDFNRAFDAIFGRDDLVTMGEAIEEYARAVSPQSGASQLYRDSIADRLSRRLTLYCLAEDGATTRAVTPTELRNARFTHGGEALVFRDGRQSVSPLAVKKSELTAAIKALKA